MIDSEPILELRFPLTARTLPADHGYILFSAICTVLPELRIENGGITNLMVLPVTGRQVGARRIAVSDTSSLSFRLPASAVPRLLPLAGKSLPIPGNSAVVLGAPSLQGLVPVPRLYARLVTIKVRDLKESAPDYAERFLVAARRMAAAVGIPADSLTIVKRRMHASIEGKIGARPGEPYLRRTLSVRHKTIAGYALAADGLSTEASLLLQSHGIGGRRHFGCGVFVPYPHHEET